MEATNSTEVLREEIAVPPLQENMQPFEHVVSYITLFSSIGVVTRIYTSFSNSFLPGHVYPQLAGCFLMGILDRNNFPPLLKLGLQIGFCGSITSFSTFILQTYLFFYSNIWDAFVAMGVLSGLSFSAYKIGSHIRFHVSIADYPKSWRLAAVVLYPTLIVIFLVFASFSTGLAIALGPIGAFVRWYCLRWNLPHFPLGTFLVNCIGVLLVCLLKISENLFMDNSLGCAWMLALEFGLIGCISTVSSFVAEVDRLEIRYAYRYFIASILSGLALAFLVLGVFKLTGNTPLSCEVRSF
jgi:fluoride ion exporter CrcB/FEX